MCHRAQLSNMVFEDIFAAILEIQAYYVLELEVGGSLILDLLDFSVTKISVVDLKALLCNLGCPVDQAGLQLTEIHLPLLPECCD